MHDEIATVLISLPAQNLEEHARGDKMQYPLVVSLSYKGNLADAHEIELYDVAQGLIGFQRSIALTTHLVLNGEIITQAPALKGAQILGLPAEEGSWKIKAAVVGAALTGVYHVGTAPRETPLGHLVFSAYDYVLSETMGFHVDYEKSIGQLLEQHKKQGGAKGDHLSQEKLDSLVEKCMSAVGEMHRPIVKQGTAREASVSARVGSLKFACDALLTKSSYEYLSETLVSELITDYVGRVSSYNTNTYKGRIYVPLLKRPIPFELLGDAKSYACVSLITRSLTVNGQDPKLRNLDDGLVKVYVYPKTTRTGRIKGFEIVDVRVASD